MQRLAIRRSSACTSGMSWLRAPSSPLPHARRSPVTWCVWLVMPKFYAFSHRVPVDRLVSRLCRRGGRPMAKTTVGAGAVAIAVLLTVCVAARVDATPRHEMVIVFHLTDDAHVSGGVLAEAQQQATRVYYAAGVRAVWRGGALPATRPD